MQHIHEATLILVKCSPASSSPVQLYNTSCLYALGGLPVPNGACAICMVDGLVVAFWYSIPSMRALWSGRSAPAQSPLPPHSYDIAVHGSADTPAYLPGNRAIGNSPRARGDILGGAATGLGGTGRAQCPRPTADHLRRPPGPSQQARRQSARPHHQARPASLQSPLRHALTSAGSPRTHFRELALGPLWLFSSTVPKRKANRQLHARFIAGLRFSNAPQRLGSSWPVEDVEASGDVAWCERPAVESGACGSTACPEITLAPRRRAHVVHRDAARILDTKKFERPFLPDQHYGHC